MHAEQPCQKRNLAARNPGLADRDQIVVEQTDAQRKEQIRRTAGARIDKG